MKRLSCFSKRDCGGIVLFSVGVTELLVAFLMSLSLKINESTLLLGVAACTLVFGIGYFVAYLTNARSRFRPSWYLPMGIFLAFIGAVALAIDIFGLRSPSVNLVSIVTVACIMNFVVSASCAFQLKALALARWFYVWIFGILNLLYAAVLYFGLVEYIKNKPLTSITVYFVLLAAQTLLEPFYYFKRDKKGLDEQ